MGCTCDSASKPSLDADLTQFSDQIKQELAQIQEEYDNPKRLTSTYKISNDQFHNIGTLIMNKITDTKFVLTLREKIYGAPKSRQISENIAAIYGYFETDDWYLWVNQYQRGGKLLEVLGKRRYMTEAQVSDIMSSLIKGVRQAHREKLVHGNLSPDCILINENSGKITIYGFGNTILTDELIKTLNYVTLCASPEAIAGSNSSKRDIWSLGVIMYILLCGKPPFYGESTAELISNIQYKDLSIPSFLSANAIDLLSRMLNKNQDERIHILNLSRHPWFESNGDDILYITPDMRKFSKEMRYRIELFNFEKAVRDIDLQARNMMKSWNLRAQNGILTIMQIFQSFSANVTIIEEKRFPMFLKGIREDSNHQIDYNEFIEMYKFKSLHTARVKVGALFDTWPRDTYKIFPSDYRLLTGQESDQIMDINDVADLMIKKV